MAVGDSVWVVVSTDTGNGNVPNVVGVHTTLANAQSHVANLYSVSWVSEGPDYLATVSSKLLFRVFGATVQA